MSEWLDSETKAILQGAPPDKLAPSEAIGYSLVLLTKPSDQTRLELGLAKAQCLTPELLATVIAGRLPQTVASGWTLEAALLGQFELACCDAIAVFLRDEVVEDDDRGYLSQLYADLLTGEEFRPTKIAIRSMPNDRPGRRFLDQFVGAGIRICSSKSRTRLSSPPCIALLLPCENERFFAANAGREG